MNSRWKRQRLLEALPDLLGGFRNTPTHASNPSPPASHQVPELPTYKPEIVLPPQGGEGTGQMIVLRADKPPAFIDTGTMTAADIVKLLQ